MSINNPSIISNTSVTNIYQGNAQPWVAKTENYSALPGNKIIADSSQASFTITLPSTPNVGDEIQVLTVGASTNALTVDPNGLNLNGAIATMNISTDKQETHFIYVGSAGWVAAVGGGAASSGGGSSPNPTLSPWQFIKQDTLTKGNWGGKYGSAGYILFNWGNGSDVASNPTYLASITKIDANPYMFTISDDRALPNNANNTGERRSPVLYGNTPTLEVFVSDAVVRKVAVYLCDFDNTRASVKIKIESLIDESLFTERTLTADDYNSGVYCQFTYSDSFKLIVSESNINNVVSAIFFD